VLIAFGIDDRLLASREAICFSLIYTKTQDNGNTLFRYPDNSKHETVLENSFDGCGKGYIEERAYLSTITRAIVRAARRIKTSFVRHRRIVKEF
jgi:hypothetical protein